MVVLAHQETEFQQETDICPRSKQPLRSGRRSAAAAGSRQFWVASFARWSWKTESDTSSVMMTSPDMGVDCWYVLEGFSLASRKRACMCNAILLQQSLQDVAQQVPKDRIFLQYPLDALASSRQLFPLIRLSCSFSQPQL